jgi:hypothetical protein
MNERTAWKRRTVRREPEEHGQREKNESERSLDRGRGRGGGGDPLQVAVGDELKGDKISGRAGRQDWTCIYSVHGYGHLEESTHGRELINRPLRECWKRSNEINK